MVDKVHLSFGRTYRSREVSVARRFGYGDWIQPSSSRLVADSEGDLASGALNAFDESHSGSSFDVTIDTGEAVVRGMYLARDTTTTVTLASSTNGQDVFVGWQDGSSDTVLIGTSGDFGSDDPKTKIWTFDTDGSGVTSATDQRRLGPTVMGDQIAGGVTGNSTISDLVGTGLQISSETLAVLESDLSLADLGSRAHEDLSDDVSGASDQDNSGTTVIQDLTFDPHGHTTGAATATIDTTDVVSSGSFSPANNEPHAVYTREDSGNSEYDTGLRDLTNGTNFVAFSEAAQDDPKSFAWSWSALDTPTVQWQVERA